MGLLLEQLTFGNISLENTLTAKRNRNLMTGYNFMKSISTKLNVSLEIRKKQGSLSCQQILIIRGALLATVVQSKKNIWFQDILPYSICSWLTTNNLLRYPSHKVLHWISKLRLCKVYYYLHYLPHMSSGGLPGIQYTPQQ